MYKAMEGMGTMVGEMEAHSKESFVEIMKKMNFEEKLLCIRKFVHENGLEEGQNELAGYDDHLKNPEVIINRKIKKIQEENYYLRNANFKLEGKNKKLTTIKKSLKKDIGEIDQKLNSQRDLLQALKAEQNYFKKQFAALESSGFEPADNREQVVRSPKTQTFFVDYDGRGEGVTFLKELQKNLRAQTENLDPFYALREDNPEKEKSFPFKPDIQKLVQEETRRRM